ncbi:MAG: hypothetical protein K2R98_00495 [Gemmataceae bacterium]|nr:hypothetical protein [Gemmataceae bacterium]
MFSAEDILARLKTRPFTPMRIVTTTGETYDVYHPNLVFVARRFLDVGTPDRRNPTVADQVTRVAILHVTELRDLPVASPPIAAQP